MDSQESLILVEHTLQCTVVCEPFHNHRMDSQEYLILVEHTLQCSKYKVCELFISIEWTVKNIGFL